MYMHVRMYCVYVSILLKCYSLTDSLESVGVMELFQQFHFSQTLDTGGVLVHLQHHDTVCGDVANLNK